MLSRAIIYVFTFVVFTVSVNNASRHSQEMSHELLTHYYFDLGATHGAVEQVFLVEKRKRKTYVSSENVCCVVAAVILYK